VSADQPCLLCVQELETWHESHYGQGARAPTCRMHLLSTRQHCRSSRPAAADLPVRNTQHDILRVTLPAWSRHKAHSTCAWVHSWWERRTWRAWGGRAPGWARPRQARQQAVVQQAVVQPSPYINAEALLRPLHRTRHPRAHQSAHDKTAVLVRPAWRCSTTFQPQNTPVQTIAKLHAKFEGPKRSREEID